MVTVVEQLTGQFNLMRVTSANRLLEELWARESELVSLLTGAVAHDLNNILASLQANAYLSRGTVWGKEAQALERIEPTIGSRVEELVERLRMLNTGATLAEPPTDEAPEAVPALLQRPDRPDCSVTLAASPKDVLISSALFRGGFLALVTLAVELMPPAGTQDLGASFHAGRARLWLSLKESAPPSFLRSRTGAGIADLPLTRMVRWLALRGGGDLTVSGDGKTFELLVPESTGSSVVGSALQRVQ